MMNAWSPPDYQPPKTRGWHNFVTDQTDWRERDRDWTDEEARQYIPQDPAALGLYEVCRLRGDSVLEAMVSVLSAAAGLPKGSQEPA